MQPWQNGELPATETAEQPTDNATQGHGTSDLSQIASSVKGEASVIQLQLSNGVKINLFQTKHQPKQCSLRMTALGSEAAEMRGEGTAGSGSAAVQLGVAAWMHGGCGGYSAVCSSHFCDTFFDAQTHLRLLHC